jgi:hypothetical protein
VARVRARVTSPSSAAPVGCRRARELLTFDPIPAVTNWQPGAFLKKFALTTPETVPDSSDEKALREAECHAGLVESCTSDEIEAAVKRGEPDGEGDATDH